MATNRDGNYRSKKKRRPHSSDTDVDDSDFQPDSDVSESQQNQKAEIDRCNRTVYVDANVETLRIINEQKEMLQQCRQDSVNDTVSNENNISGVIESDNETFISDNALITNSGADEFSNFNDIGSGLNELEALVDYDYDESFASSKGSNVSTQGGLNVSPDGSNRVNPIENNDISNIGGINRSPERSNRANSTTMTNGVSNQGGLILSPEGSNDPTSHIINEVSTRGGINGSPKSSNQVSTQNPLVIRPSSNPRKETKSSKSKDVFKGNVWTSGLRRDDITQESPFSKNNNDELKQSFRSYGLVAGNKDVSKRNLTKKIKSKSVQNRRNTVVLEEDSETEDLNKKLVANAKHVGSIVKDKKLADIIASKKACQAVIEENNLRFDKIINKHKKRLSSKENGSGVSIHPNTNLTITDQTVNSPTRSNTSSIRPNAKSSTNNFSVSFRSSATVLSETHGSSTSASTPVRKIVEARAKEKPDFEDTGYLFVPQCALFFCVQAKVGLVTKDIGCKIDPTQRVIRYDRPMCRAHFKHKQLRYLKDCSCKKRYKVHISNNHELVEHMSELYIEAHRETRPQGSTQQIINRINRNDMEKFEQGYKNWLIRITNTPPIHSPSSAALATAPRNDSVNILNKEDVAVNLNILQLPSDDNDEESTPFVDTVDSGAVVNSQIHEEEINSVSNKAPVTRIPRKTSTPSVSNTKSKENINDSPASRVRGNITSESQFDRTVSIPSTNRSRPQNKIRRQDNRVISPRDDNRRNEGWNNSRDNGRPNVPYVRNRNNVPLYQNRNRRSPRGNYRNSNENHNSNDWNNRNNSYYRGNQYDHNSRQFHNNYNDEYHYNRNVQWDDRRHSHYNSPGHNQFSDNRNYHDDPSMYRHMDRPLFDESRREDVFRQSGQLQSVDLQRNSFQGRDENSRREDLFRQSGEFQPVNSQRNSFQGRDENSRREDVLRQSEQYQPVNSQRNLFQGRDDNIERLQVNNSNQPGAINIPESPTSGSRTIMNTEISNNNATIATSIRNSNPDTESIITDTENEVSVVSNCLSTNSDKASGKKHKKAPANKTITFCDNGESVDYMFVGHTEIFSGCEHALVDGAFYLMTDDNVKVDNNMNKYIRVDNVKANKRSDTILRENNNDEKVNNYSSDENSKKQKSKKEKKKLTKKRKDHVSFLKSSTNAKKKQKTTTTNMTKVCDVNHSTKFGRDTAKRIFKGLLESNQVDETWRTQQVEFYDEDEPETSLLFRYTSVGIKKGCEKANFTDYDLSDVMWAFSGFGKHLVVNSLRVIESKSGIHEPFNVFTEKERESRMKLKLQREKLLAIIDAKKNAKM